MKKKLLCSLLTLLLLSSLLLGCAVPPLSAEEPLPSGETEIGCGGLNAEIYDLHGHEFLFYHAAPAAEQFQSREIYAEAVTGDHISDAVLKRNEQLQKTYNATLKETYTVAERVSETLRDPLLAGEYVCDYLYADVTELFPLARAGLLTDLNEPKNINLASPWWDEALLSGLNVGGKTFLIGGDASLSDELATVVLGYDREYVKELFPERDLHQAVTDGSWTVSLLYDLLSRSQGASLPARGGIALPENANEFFFLGAGITLAEYSPADITIPAEPQDSLLAAWDVLRPLLSSPYRTETEDPSSFFDGSAAFALGCVADFFKPTRPIRINLGLLPLPKLNADEAHYRSPLAIEHLRVYSIPVTVESAPHWRENGFTSGAEQAAYFLEAVGFYSYRYLTPALWEQYLLKQSATDMETVEVFELILKHRTVDPVAQLPFGDLAAIYADPTLPREELLALYREKLRSTRKAVESFILSIYEQPDPT